MRSMLIISLALAQITWYTQRTCTDPLRHGYLIGEVGLADFIFGEVEKNGALVCPAGASVSPSGST
jgi:hypothetical protein